MRLGDKAAVFWVRSHLSPASALSIKLIDPATGYGIGTQNPFPIFASFEDLPGAPIDQLHDDKDGYQRAAFKQMRLLPTEEPKNQTFLQSISAPVKFVNPLYLVDVLHT
jgi:hypothetical protein